MLVMGYSPTESLRTSILEWMASGTRVYATAVSGTCDVIIPGETGYLVGTAESTEMAEQALSVVQSDSEGSALSERCRGLIEQRLSLEAARGRYRSILDTAVS